MHSRRIPMYIKYQKIVRDEAGIILSGSASIQENSYKRNKNGNRNQSHTAQSTVEKLGKVIWYEKDNPTQGIFYSPTRGLTFYDLNLDSFSNVDPKDPRLSGTKYEYEPQRLHTNFGNFYLFFTELANTPFLTILRKTFGECNIYKKLLAHLVHDCLKNGSSIKCGEYLARSSLSYIVEDIPVSTLDCDTSYYFEMSNDNLKVAYFKSVLEEMRKINPNFGRCCYVDSTPLPGEAENNPFNALSSHGSDGAVIQSRLVLILDIQSSVPVWFEIIPANILDKSTIMSITSDVEKTLGITIDMYDLDAGYAREELFGRFNRNNSTYIDEDNEIRDHTVLIRMPATNGYGRDDLYIQSKTLFHDPEYEFDYEHHTFFGKRYEIDLFGYPEFGFVFVDKTQAESLLREWRTAHWDEWVELSKSAKEWYSVKNGFFVLIGNKDQIPKSALVEYRGRTSIESYFRDSKAYLKILPLKKWTKETVTGKIFHDTIVTTVYRAFRKEIAPADMSMSSLIVHMESWECVRKSDHLLEIKTPNIQVRETLEKLGLVAPAHLDLGAMRKEILQGVPMSRVPITASKRRKAKKEAPPISPEEKKEAMEKAKAEREQRNAEEKAQKEKERAEAKAQKEKEKAKAKAKKEKEKAKAKAEKEKEKAATKKPKGKTQTAKSEIDDVNHTKKKPGVPVGYKRGTYNKDGSVRKKPGPKPKQQ